MLNRLKLRLMDLGKIAVAYSGGIDSAFLVAYASQVLPKEHVTAILVDAPQVPRTDYKEAVEFAEAQGINLIQLKAEPFTIPEFQHNAEDRCYHCKKALMGMIIKTANEAGFPYVADGGNVDDHKVYRPGHRAVEELGLVSPLADCGFTKEDIRKAAKEIGIPFWDKPSNSCLATRFPYNTTLTPEGLQRVDEAEEMLRELGIGRRRVRVENNVARIEVEKNEITKVAGAADLGARMRELGFDYVTLDLNGYQSGTYDGKLGEDKE